MCDVGSSIPSVRGPKDRPECVTTSMKVSLSAGKELRHVSVLFRRGH